MRFQISLFIPLRNPSVDPIGLRIDSILPADPPGRQMFLISDKLSLSPCPVQNHDRTRQFSHSVPFPGLSTFGNQNTALLIQDPVPLDLRGVFHLNQSVFCFSVACRRPGLHQNVLLSRRKIVQSAHPVLSLIGDRTGTDIGKLFIVKLIFICKIPALSVIMLFIDKDSDGLSAVSQKEHFCTGRKCRISQKAFDLAVGHIICPVLFSVCHPGQTPSAGSVISVHLLKSLCELFVYFSVAGFPDSHQSVPVTDRLSVSPYYLSSLISHSLIESKSGAFYRDPLFSFERIFFKLHFCVVIKKIYNLDLTTASDLHGHGGTGNKPLWRPLLFEHIIPLRKTLQIHGFLCSGPSDGPTARFVTENQPCSRHLSVAEASFSFFFRPHGLRPSPTVSQTHIQDLIFVCVRTVDLPEQDPGPVILHLRCTDLSRFLYGHAFGKSFYITRRGFDLFHDINSCRHTFQQVCPAVGHGIVKGIIGRLFSCDPGVLHHITFPLPVVQDRGLRISGLCQIRGSAEIAGQIRIFSPHQVSVPVIEQNIFFISAFASPVINGKSQNVEHRQHGFRKRSRIFMDQGLPILAVSPEIPDGRGHLVAPRSVCRLPGPCEKAFLLSLGPWLPVFPYGRRSGSRDLVRCRDPAVPVSCQLYWPHIHFPFIFSRHIGHTCMRICQAVPGTVSVQMPDGHARRNGQDFVFFAVLCLCKISSCQFQIRPASFKGKYREFPIRTCHSPPVIFQLFQIYQPMVPIISVGNLLSLYIAVRKYIQISQIIPENIRIGPFRFHTIPVRSAILPIPSAKFCPGPPVSFFYVHPRHIACRTPSDHQAFISVILRIP